MYDRTFREKRTTLKQNSRSAKLILEIGDLIEDTYFGLSRPGLVVKFGVDGAKEFLNRQEAHLRCQELKRLEKKALIIKEKIADSYMISFSQAGFEEYITQLSLNADELPNNKICVVSFDVPETHRRLRDQARRLLKNLGFQQMHRSVWFCNKDVVNYVARLFSSRFKPDNWFKVFVTSNL